MESYQYTGTELTLFAQACNWKSYVATHVLPFLKGDVLEVGAGLGANTVYLANKSASAWLCLEPDEMNFIALKKLIADTRLPLAITVKQGTVGDLPQETSFDTILYYDVLEHIENDEEELHLACKHLNPGGCIIVVAPAHQSLYSAFDKAIGHYRRYDKNLLRFVVPDSLKETRCIYLDSLGYFAYKAFSVFSGKENVSLNKVLFWDRCLVPLSRIFDPLIGYSIGKSVLGIWKKNLQ